MPWRSDFMHLRIGARYRVVAPFTDFDRERHEPGEAWIFRGHSFLPYDEGLSLFVLPEDGVEQQIRLRWLPDDQGYIIDNLSAYIAEAP
jgi:hypothetical protein